MKVYNIFEYMKKIIGDIKVYGEDTRDNKSFKNLSEYEEIMKSMVYEIAENLRYKNRQEDSTKKIYGKSLKVLKNTRDVISEVLEEEE